MRSLLALSVHRILFGFVVLGLLGGCSGKKISTGVGDQTSIPGPQAEAPPPPTPAPVVEVAPEPPPPAVAEMPPPPAPVAEEPPPPPAPVAEEPPPPPAPEPPPPPPAEPPPSPPVVVEPPPPAPVAEEPPPPPPVLIEPSPAPEPPPMPLIAEAPAAKPIEPPPPVEQATELQDVYFDFDQSVLRADARATLEENAKLLRSSTGGKILIEGHCDERGTSAYNLILGEQRAKSVRRYLENLGIPGSRLQVVSYGKERPFCKEHNDECWQSNRRAHFVAK